MTQPMYLANVATDMTHIRARQETRDVKELAESIKKHGLLEPLGAREGKDGSWSLLYGRDRYSALLLAGRTEAPFVLHRCDDEEAVRIKAEENIRRRTDTREDLAALAALAGPAKPGERKTARGKAMDVLAKARGVKAKSIKQQARREKIREKKATEAKAPIESFGVPLDAAFAKKLALRFRATNRVLDAIHTAATLASNLGERDLAKMLEEAWEQAEPLVPRFLCPWCKGLVGCAKCEGRMHVWTLEGVPEVLTATDPLMVWVNGKPVPVEAEGF